MEKGPFRSIEEAAEAYGEAKVKEILNYLEGRDMKGTALYNCFNDLRSYFDRKNLDSRIVKEDKII